MEDQESSYLMEKKVEYLVNMKVGKIQTLLSEAISKINSMEEEISVLKNKVQRLNLGVNTQKIEPQTTLASTGEEEVKKEATPAENPRSGGISPSEVSVEKMFYFGNKKS